MGKTEGQDCVYEAFKDTLYSRMFLTLNSGFLSF